MLQEALHLFYRILGIQYASTHSYSAYSSCQYRLDIRLQYATYGNDRKVDTMRLHLVNNMLIAF